MATDPAQGFLGRPLAEVTQSGFFNWFHLAETGSVATREGGRTVSYRPSGPRFQRLTTLEVAVAADGTVRSMDLLLLREFIASPANAPFARDIAKSFLRAAPVPGDEEALRSIADEVEYRSSPSDAKVIVGPAYRVPELPSPPSAAYEAYAGSRPSYAQALPHAKLEMTNEQDPDGAALRITLIAK